MKKIIGVLLLSSLLLLGCLHEGKSGVASGQVVGGVVGGVVAQQTDGAFDGVTLKMVAQTSPWKFEPSEIRVKQGQRVRLVVSVAEGDLPHGLALPDFGVNEFLSKGETTVEFVADKPTGSYNGFCSFWCGQGHREMRLKIIVE